MIVDQVPLWPVTGAIARRSDPETSHAAAASVGKGVEHAILALFQTSGQWWTDDELAEHFPTIHPPTVKSARSRLTKAGFLADSGQRGISNRGRAMVIWRLA